MNLLTKIVGFQAGDTIEIVNSDVLTKVINTLFVRSGTACVVRPTTKFVLMRRYAHQDGWGRSIGSSWGLSVALPDGTTHGVWVELADGEEFKVFRKI